MRMLDVDSSKEVKTIQLYFTIEEAKEFIRGLKKLLEKPEAINHCHIASGNQSRDLSFSLITSEKLKRLDRYTELERSILKED